MSSRFTETDKWKDPWFRTRSPYAKCVWEYLRDNCDIAGVIEYDPASIAFHTGLTEKQLEGAMEELKRGFLSAGGYIMLRTFLKYQRNVPLNENNAAHRGILKRIEAVSGLFPNALKQIQETGVLECDEGATKGLASPLGIGIGKGSGKGRGTGKRETQSLKPSGDAPLPFESKAFADAWAMWLEHRKEIKKKPTENAKRLQLAQLAKWGEAKAIEAIKKSITSGWIGLFEPDEKAAGHATPVSKPMSMWEMDRAIDAKKARMRTISETNNWRDDPKLVAEWRRLRDDVERIKREQASR